MKWLKEKIKYRPSVPPGAPMPTWEDYDLCCYGEGSKPTKRGYVWCYITTYIRAWQCKHFGHKYVSNSWAGPDTGGEEHYCTRCGYSWEHTYY